MTYKDFVPTTPSDENILQCFTTFYLSQLKTVSLPMVINHPVCQMCHLSCRNE